MNTDLIGLDTDNWDALAHFGYRSMTAALHKFGIWDLYFGAWNFERFDSAQRRLEFEFYSTGIL